VETERGETERLAVVHGPNGLHVEEVPAGLDKATLGRGGGGHAEELQWSGARGRGVLHVVAARRLALLIASLLEK